MYVDDRKELPKASQFNFKRANGQLKEITTVGDKWATFQTVNFKTASQPYYVQLTSEFEILNSAEQYTDIDTYLAWLKEGIINFKNVK